MKRGTRKAIRTLAKHLTATRSQALRRGKGAVAARAKRRLEALRGLMA